MPTLDSLPEVNQLLATPGYPTASAEWVVDQLRTESLAGSIPFSSDDAQVLLSDVREFALDSEFRLEMIGINNRGVELIRRAITAAKSQGAPTVRARRGLRLPYWWEVHYEVLYVSNCPAFVSAVVQNAFHGNPMAGETKPWKSK